MTDCFAELVILYFQRFGSKACCFDDLLKYITPLVKASSPSLLKITDFLDAKYAAQNIDVSVSKAYSSSYSAHVVLDYGQDELLFDS